MTKKILVIDDEPELVKAVEIRLKTTGYKVEVAYDGLSGIDKAKETKPDLILLDIIMPKMDGYEVCKTLKSNSKTKDIPIIIFTASIAVGQQELEKKCVSAGAQAAIIKPFETQDLLNIIDEILKKEE
jgi:CheY-like chemotaxis protein